MFTWLPILLKFLLVMPSLLPLVNDVIATVKNFKGAPDFISIVDLVKEILIVILGGGKAHAATRLALLKVKLVNPPVTTQGLVQDLQRMKEDLCFGTR